MQIPFIVDLVNRNDVWIVERRGGPGFAFETFHSPGVFSELRRQDLDCNTTIEFQVICEIDFAHAAGAYLRNDLVMCEFLSGSQRRTRFTIKTKTLARRFLKKAARHIESDQ